MNSWAKFKYHSDRALGSEALSFYFLWENPRDKFAVINIDAYLVLNGFCSVIDGQTLLTGYDSSSLNLQAQLSIREWWNQPPTSPLPQSDLLQSVVSLSAKGGSISGGAIDGKHIFRGYDLRYNQFLVPPKGVAVFEVALTFSYKTSVGDVHVNFASEDFEVLCLGVLVAILA
ncbi:hypothetical protein NC796_10830 [Aliifodinibius sp. S!AR15-10]|uniref:hypothetical protein n=1 Tax=Aliifodinibius sp. S!AR15-10 TaxID=2950437 RepID=UPI002855DA85|nr:hypothetical protein [Aliifodinibius sp. S!AR15-10]MDR8391638.1 hypothetical protein [Aliifodinibius sp. S!AR15-10]